MLCTPLPALINIELPSLSRRLLDSVHIYVKIRIRTVCCVNYAACKIQTSVYGYVVYVLFEAYPLMMNSQNILSVRPLNHRRLLCRHLLISQRFRKQTEFSRLRSCSWNRYIPAYRGAAHVIDKAVIVFVNRTGFVIIKIEVDR